MGVLRPGGHHTPAQVEAEPREAVGVQTLRQHPRVQHHLQHHLHALEHQVSQGRGLPNTVERSLGG